MSDQEQTDHKKVEWAVMQHHARSVSVSSVFTVHIAYLAPQNGVALVTKDGTVHTLQRVYVWDQEGDGICLGDAPCSHTPSSR